MSEFLIKSSVTMAVLLGLYYLLFEKEKMHRFSRFYLLSALVFSLVIPFITIITYTKYATATPTISANTIVLPIKETVNYWPHTGWLLYVLITIIMLARFVKNVIPLLKKASGNPSIKMEIATLVLLEEKVLPHTFLNYIFVNREEHEARLIEEELYTHELTHVRQKHTLDILFIEALKTIFWFNPLLYFYKKAIQLNHEFLADEKVIDTANTVYYQNLLLEKASVGTTFSMASNLNFSLTKKRLLMMTKSTSAIKANLLKTTIVPAVAALMMLLCTKTVAQEKPATVPSKQNKTETTKKTDNKPNMPEKTKEARAKDKKNSPGKPSQTEEKKENEMSFNIEKVAPENTRTYTLGGEVKIDPGRVQSVEIEKLTELEIKGLKTFDPQKYNDETLKDYVGITIFSTNDKGELTAQKIYQKKPY